jgi:hypothetical protein
MRGIRALLMVPILAAAVTGAGLARPAVTLACSCMMPPALEVLAKDNPEIVIVAGRVGLGLPDGSFEFAVERWFHGPQPRGSLAVVSDTMPGPGGQVTSNSCGVHVETGNAMFFAASFDEQGRLQPSLCWPFGSLDDPDGRALFTEAEAAFGPGLPTGDGGGPTSPTDSPASPTTPNPTDAADAGLDPFILAAIGIALAAGLGIFGLVALVSRGRRPTEP